VYKRQVSRCSLVAASSATAGRQAVKIKARQTVRKRIPRDVGSWNVIAGGGVRRRTLVRLESVRIVLEVAEAEVGQQTRTDDFVKAGGNAVVVNAGATSQTADTVTSAAEVQTIRRRTGEMEPVKAESSEGMN